jgi:tetratricopeptide (TPR) repeat protein
MKPGGWHHMNRPRLFLSAVSDELRTARKEVAATLNALGFDTVSQDGFPTGHGVLRNWLREQIDSCSGLIQLVGSAYGTEPPSIDPDYSRVSYTQFEFLYASRQGKKTWVIVIGENYPRDNPIENLDLPVETTHPDPTAYQAERRKLQKNYKERLKQENHLLHTANNDTELQNKIFRLRDELGELRQRGERRIRLLAGAIMVILILIVVFGGRVWWANNKLYNFVEQSAVVNTEKIRAHLMQTADETHRRELAEADAVKDWKERQRLREAADKAHDARLTRIEELAASFAEIEGRGTTTSVFQEMTRILTEQGVDEAIAYVASQRPSILKTVRARAASARERNRADLEPLLLTAGMYETKGQFDEAYALYSEIITIAPEWARPRNDLSWFLIQRGTAIEPEPGNKMLKEAVEICRGTIALSSKEKVPQDWAETQNNLGSALQEHGIRTGGEVGAELLSQAVAAFREALTVFTRDSLPQNWAATHNNLGSALKEQGIRTEGEVGAELLSQAVSAYRATLTAFTRDSLPQNWAITQNNLGNALKEQGIRTEGEAGAELLSQAVTAFREALTVRTRDSLPQYWAGTQNNLGNALFELGRVKKSIDLLIEAKAVIQSIYSFFKDAGYSQYDQYFDEKLSEIEQTIKELS